MFRKDYIPGELGILMQGIKKKIGLSDALGLLSRSWKEKSDGLVVYGWGTYISIKNSV